MPPRFHRLVDGFSEAAFASGCQAQVMQQIGGWVSSYAASNFDSRRRGNLAR